MNIGIKYVHDATMYGYNYNAIFISIIVMNTYHRTVFIIIIYYSN